MKFLINSFVLFLIITQLIACKKEVVNPSNPLPVTASAVAGNFTISSFISGGANTTAFNGFVFTFTGNGIIVATNGSDTFNGAWKFDDSNNTEIKINFPAAPLNALNRSWHIEEITNERLLLIDNENGETEGANDDYAAGDDRLEFKRN